MRPAANPPGPDGPSVALLEAATRVMSAWAERTILDRLGRPGDAPDIQMRVAAVAETMAADIIAQLSALLMTDVGSQATSPLAVIRERVGPANELLTDLGAPVPRRDDFERRSFPDDRFGVSPSTWADIDASLQEPGLIWGAWKAMTMMQRHAQTGADDDQY